MNTGSANGPAGGGAADAGGGAADRGGGERTTDAGGARSAEANRRAWTVAIFASLGLAGAVLMVRGPVLPELATAFGAPEWQLGLIAPAATLGYLVAVTAVGFGAGHLPPRRLVVAGLGGTAVALGLLGAAPSLPTFLVAVALQGATVGAFRGRTRPLLSHFYPTRRGRVYSYYDMTWAAGATLGPLLVIAVLALAPWRWVFWVLAAAYALVAAFVWSLSEPELESEERPLAREDVLALLRRPEILGMVAVMFFATGVEGGLFLWLPTYAAGELPDWLAGAVLSLMILGYVPGRFAYGRLAERVGYVRLLVGILGALLPVYLLTFFVAGGLWLLPGILAIGVLLSGAFPLLVSYATDATPEYSGPVTAVAAVAGSLGVGVVPAMMGFAISSGDAAAGMELLVVPLVASIGLVVAVRVSERRRTPAEPVCAAD